VLERESGFLGFLGRSVKILVKVADEAAPLQLRKEAVERMRGAIGATLITEEAEAVVPIAAAAKPGRERPREEDAGEDETSSRSDVIRGPAAREALLEILSRMDVKAEVTVREDAEAATLNIRSAEEEFVIGRDGEVLAALQFLVNRIANRGSDDRKRVILDAEGFRDRREAAMGDLARKMGAVAVSSGRVIRMSPMNAQDRRLMHMALKDHPDLTTRSEGEGLFRCLLIVPNPPAEPQDGRAARPEGSRGRHRHRGHGRPRTGP
jgi:spoIIIJ-associated protein